LVFALFMPRGIFAPNSTSARYFCRRQLVTKLWRAISAKKTPHSANFPHASLGFAARSDKKYWQRVRESKKRDLPTFSGNLCFLSCSESHSGHLLCLNVLKRRNEMTQKERRQLIELGILTEDCGPSVTYWKLSPQLKRELRRRMNERERMTGGRLLTRILECLKRA
jgi:hypothetical protein